MDELKPCPFCGGEAERTKPGWSNFYQKKLYGVHCIDAGCVAFDTEPHFFKQKDADDAWNRRAEPENKALTLEQLKSMGGKPIYFHSIETGHNWYAILGVQDEIQQYFQTGSTRRLSNYGITWLAYAHKPE
jgi:hypothetical protein